MGCSPEPVKTSRNVYGSARSHRRPSTVGQAARFTARHREDVLFQPTWGHNLPALTSGVETMIAYGHSHLSFFLDRSRNSRPPAIHFLKLGQFH